MLHFVKIQLLPDPHPWRANFRVGLFLRLEGFGLVSGISLPLRNKPAMSNIKLTAVWGQECPVVVCDLLREREPIRGGVNHMAKGDLRHAVEHGIIEHVGREDDGAGYYVYSFTAGCEYRQVKNPVQELEAAVEEFYRRTRHVPARWFIVAELSGAARPKELVSVHQDFASAMGTYGEQEPGQCGVFRKAENNRLELVF